MCGPDFEGSPIVNGTLEQFNSRMENLKNLLNMTKILSEKYNCNVNKMAETVPTFRYLFTQTCIAQVALGVQAGCPSIAATIPKMCNTECDLGKQALDSVIKNKQFCTGNTPSGFDAICPSATDEPGCIKNIPAESVCGFVSEDVAEKQCLLNGVDECCTSRFLSGAEGRHSKNTSEGIHPLLIIIGAIAVSVIAFVIVTLITIKRYRSRKSVIAERVAPLDIIDSYEKSEIGSVRGNGIRSWISLVPSQRFERR